MWTEADMIKRLTLSLQVTVPRTQLSPQPPGHPPNLDIHFSSHHTPRHLVSRNSASVSTHPQTTTPAPTEIPSLPSPSLLPSPPLVSHLSFISLSHLLGAHLSPNVPNLLIQERDGKPEADGKKMPHKQGTWLPLGILHNDSFYF